MAIELCPDGWDTPHDLPARTSAEFTFTEAGPGTLHVRVAVRPVSLSALTMSVRAGGGQLVELSDLRVEVFGDADQRNPAGTASVEDEGHGVHRIFIELNPGSLSWTLVVDNTATTPVSINAVAAGTDDEASRPWIAVPQEEIRIVEGSDQPIPGSVAVRFQNWGTGTLVIDQDDDSGTATRYRLERVDPDQLEPGGVGTLTWTVLAEGDTSTPQSVKCNDPDASHSRIRLVADASVVPDQLLGS